MSEKTPCSIEVDSNRCTRCAACVDDCLARIIVMSENEPPRIVSGEEARCFKCRHCLAICPTGALSWNGETAENCAPMGPIPTPETMERLLRQRRSVRAYKRENVSEEIFERLARAMDFVPTGCNDRAFFFSYSDNGDNGSVPRRPRQVLDLAFDDELPEKLDAMECSVKLLHRASRLLSERAHLLQSPFLLRLATRISTHTLPRLNLSFSPVPLGLARAGTAWHQSVQRAPELYKMLNIPMSTN